MSYSDEFLENITIDVCKKTFVLYMDDGQKRKVKCDTTLQFMDVLQLINNSGDPRIWRLSIDIEQSKSSKENFLIDLIKEFKGY